MSQTFCGQYFFHAPVCTELGLIYAWMENRKIGFLILPIAYADSQEVDYDLQKWILKLFRAEEKQIKSQMHFPNV